jgi:hypothetical protein
MKVRLSRVLADYLDGVDVRNRHAGDVLDLPEAQARLLVAEQWAVPERRSIDVPPASGERRRPGTEPSPDTPHSSSRTSRERL